MRFALPPVPTHVIGRRDDPVQGLLFLAFALADPDNLADLALNRALDKPLALLRDTEVGLRQEAEKARLELLHLNRRLTKPIHNRKLVLSFRNCDIEQRMRI